MALATNEGEHSFDPTVLAPDYLRHMPQVERVIYLSLVLNKSAINNDYGDVEAYLQSNNPRDESAKQDLVMCLLARERREEKAILDRLSIDIREFRFHSYGVHLIPGAVRDSFPLTREEFLAQRGNVFLVSASTWSTAKLLLEEHDFGVGTVMLPDQILDAGGYDISEERQMAALKEAQDISKWKYDAQFIVGGTDSAEKYYDALFVLQGGKIANTVHRKLAMTDESFDMDHKQPPVTLELSEESAGVLLVCKDLVGAARQGTEALGRHLLQAAKIRRRHVTKELEIYAQEIRSTIFVPNNVDTILQSSFWGMGSLIASGTPEQVAKYYMNEQRSQVATIFSRYPQIKKVIACDRTERVGVPRNISPYPLSFVQFRD